MSTCNIKNRFRSKAILLAGLILLNGVASAAQARWTEGFGQGNFEYFIDSGDMRLMISCPTENGSSDEKSDVTLYNAKTFVSIAAFTLKVNGSTYAGPFSADSRVGENNFLSLLDDLRTSNAVIQYAGKRITLPKSNAAKALPKFGSKDFACNLQ